MSTTSTASPSSVTRLTPGTDSSTSSSVARATPQTTESSTNGLAGQVASMRLASIDPDLPIPSVEQASSNSTNDVFTPTGSSRSGRNSTPSFSFSPPPRPNAAAANTSSGSSSSMIGIPTPSRDSTATNGALGMNDVAAALNDVARGSDGRLLSPTPRDLSAAYAASSSPRQRVRHRSSSRGSTPIHDVATEVVPEQRFHQPAFQQAFARSKQLVGELAGVLRSSSIHNEPDSTMRRLHDETSRLAEFQCPSTRTVGFVGDSGVGKSSLLNSLLDTKSLARTSNSGAACTCVVTEYRYHADKFFAIDVEWFTSDELRSQISDLLQDYRRFHLHKNEIDKDDYEDCANRAELASHTFKAMFGAKVTKKAFLLEGGSENQEEILKKLLGWADEAGSSNMQYQTQHQSLHDCSEALMALTSEVATNRAALTPATWPYIKRIKVFLNAHILSKGLVLVDLPGLRDLNSARQNITERYIRKCDEIFVVCAIGRATSDASVKIVFDLAKRAKLSNVGIVCTKSDEIRADEAKRDWKGERAKEIQRLMGRVDNYKQTLEDIDTQIAALGADTADFTEDEKQEHYDLVIEAGELRGLLEKGRFELHRYLVSRRNEDITTKLRTEYANAIPNNTPRVFCISNTEYWEHRDRPVSKAREHLELSGVIVLRRHCIAMVAESQLRIATRYMSSDIPALLGEIRLWVESGSGSNTAEKKERIRETMDAMEALLKRELTGNSSELNQIASEHRRMFQHHISSKVDIDQWADSSEEASLEWSGWHHSTYSAFCRNYGDHCTPAVGQHCWNEEAIQGMTRDLTRPWRVLCTALRVSREDKRAVIGRTWDQITDVLDNLEPDDSVRLIFDTLNHRRNLLQDAVEDEMTKSDQALSSLATDAMSGIRTSNVGKLMEKSYRACQREGGRGSDGRRKFIIEDRFADHALFQRLQTEFEKQFRALADTLQQSVRDAIAEHLSVVQGTLDIVRSENVALESEKDPEFRSRVDTAVRASVAEINQIKARIGA